MNLPASSANTLTPLESEEARWNAVQERDAGTDGLFVYAVRSTGIYCRPSCPSRRPKRSHVTFYATPDAAERAGFRACLRCRPNEVAVQKERVQKVCRYIEANLDDRLDLNTLALECGWSPSHLQRAFKKIVGVSPRQYADALRMERFKMQVQQGETITTALYDAGYNASSRLYARTPSRLGMRPTTYQKGGKGMCITYIITSCALGYLLVAATERGLCAIRLGDSESELETVLSEEFSGAERRQDAGALREWVEPLLRYLEGEPIALEMPLDIQATAFQWRVWNHLRTIPYGSTQSYGEIARELGQPKAVRAVARACASNPVALTIPCHRVVRENGELTGYRWGAERKKALLEQERKGQK